MILSKTDKIRAKIAQCIPQDRLILKPDTTQHVYHDTVTGGDYTSVTTRLSVLDNKDNARWRMNRSLEYVYDHYQDITDEETKRAVIAAAKEYPETLFESMGSKGTSAHKYLSDYLQAWSIHQKPAGTLANALEAAGEQDFSVWSAVRSFDNWLAGQTSFLPLASEIMVWSERYRVAGTIDLVAVVNGQLTIVDFKTSSHLKPEYVLQVGAYWGMFQGLTRLRPKACIIIRLSKEHPEFQEESVANPRHAWKGFVTIASAYDVMQHLKLNRPKRQTIKL